MMDILDDDDGGDMVGMVAAQPGFEVLWLSRDKEKGWWVFWVDPVVAWKVKARGCVPVTIGKRLRSRDHLVKYPDGRVRTEEDVCYESVEAAVADMNAKQAAGAARWRVVRSEAAAFVAERYADGGLRYWKDKFWRRRGDDWLRVRKSELQFEVLEWLNNGNSRGPDGLSKFDDMKWKARSVCVVLHYKCSVKSWAGGPVDEGNAFADEPDELDERPRPRLVAERSEA